MAEPASDRRSTVEILRTPQFALTSFGGPIAHLGQFRRQYA